MRYSVINAGGGLIAEIVKEAPPFKAKWGDLAYIVACIKLKYNGFTNPWLRYTVSTYMPDGKVNKYTRECDTAFA